MAMCYDMCGKNPLRDTEIRYDVSRWGELYVVWVNIEINLTLSHDINECLKKHITLKKEGPVAYVDTKG